MSSCARIVIVERQNLVRYGLERALSRAPWLEVVASVERVQDLPLTPGPDAPDAILYSPPAYDHAGTEPPARTLDRLVACAPVLLVSGFVQPYRLLGAVRAGVLGCVTDQVDDEELLRAVGTVVTGGFHLSATLVPRLRNELEQPGGIEPRSLARRELEALRLLAEGLTHGQIGRRMGLSEATVSTYVKRIRAKLNVGNKADLTRTAIELGLLREPRPKLAASAVGPLATPGRAAGGRLTDRAYAG
ncbi:response regulator transcription factor [Streptomyces catenulae]|uniref:response regulator transcription factor n=1 Tax=Streptomyces catenulae TaxID=66875 RepID=UPI0009983D64|nr:response regulator transcription factor [Streptomyces catenulae]